MYRFSAFFRGVEQRKKTVGCCTYPAMQPDATITLRKVDPADDAAGRRSLPD